MDNYSDSLVNDTIKDIPVNRKLPYMYSASEWYHVLLALYALYNFFYIAWLRAYNHNHSMQWMQCCFDENHSPYVVSNFNQLIDFHFIEIRIFEEKKI